MSTIDDLPTGWAVKHGDPIEIEVDNTGIRATMTFIGPWSSFYAFVEAVAGYEEEVEAPGGGTYTRKVPLQFPDERFTDVYATGLHMRGYGRTEFHSTRGAQYPFGTARVMFQSQAFYVGAGSYPYVSMNWGGSADIITVPGTAYEFPSDSLRLSQNVGVLIPNSDFTLTLHNLPSLDSRIAAWNGLVGRVNSSALATPYGNLAAGLVQFLNYDTSTQMQIGNILIHQAALKFRFRWLDHNKIARPDGGGFEAPEIVGGSDKLIPTADLNGAYV